MLLDLRYAIRQLGRAPGFALVAVLSLALGIGANTVIFTIANAMLLRPVTDVDPGTLVRVYRGRHSPLDYSEWVAVRAGTPVFASMGGERVMRVGRTDEPEPASLSASITVGDYFPALGVRPALGRLFTAADTTAASASLVVLGHHYWSEHFDRDAGVLGRELRLNGQAFTVVGVAPERHTSSMLLWRPDVFFAVPATEPLLGTPPARWGGSIYAFARLGRGVSRDRADAMLGVTARRIAAADPERYANVRGGPLFRVGVARGLVEELRGPFTIASAFMLVLVGLVLLIACANVANLLLARATSRRREMGVRVALGAGRLRLVRQLLVESLVLASAGGAIGLAASAWLTPKVGRAMAARAPEQVLLDFAPDGRVLLYTMLLCVGTAIVFGLLPAARASRPDVLTALKDGGRGATDRGSRLRSVLVSGQVALCTVVLAGAALFLHSLANARVIDPGFPTEGLIDVAIDVGPRRLSPEARRDFFDRLQERARAIPGVRAATIAELVPLNGSNMETGLWIEGSPNPERTDGMRMSHFNVVGDGYFRTIGIPLVRGREFTEADLRADSAALAAGAGTLVVNETFARRMWPGREAIGRRVSFSGPDGPWSTVVGVARDARYNSLGEDTPTFAYLPYGPGRRDELVLQVRATPGAESSVIAALRHLVAELDPALPPAAPVPIAQDMATALLPAQVGAALLGAFGTLALLLASVGIYGVMSYAVAQRTHEIGIRTALGASRRAVVALVLGSAARQVGAGLGIGLLLALALSWALRTQLYGVGTGDPLTFLATPAILAGVAALAAWLPARRASRVDPVVALRVE